MICDALLGLTVTPLAAIHDSKAERILVTAFDPALPMGESFLPDGIPTASEKEADSLRRKMMWVFSPAHSTEQKDADCHKEATCPESASTEKSMRMNTES